MELAITVLIIFLVVDAILILAWYQDKKRKRKKELQEDYSMQNKID
ncbi:MAG TPA: hypothetical protein VLH61_01360 [Bacteroidales bacterium]|nr:hypothetical protein [Bacteroidales bacterium]